MANTARETSAVLYVNVPTALKTALAEQATANDRTLSAELRVALREHLTSKASRS